MLEKPISRFGPDLVALGMFARRPVAILDHYGSSDWITSLYRYMGSKAPC
jgi:hypothetical protein